MQVRFKCILFEYNIMVHSSHCMCLTNTRHILIYILYFHIYKALFFAFTRQVFEFYLDNGSLISVLLH